jgi:hypothetical protein
MSILPYCVSRPAPFAVFAVPPVLHLVQELSLTHGVARGAGPLCTAGLGELI